ncbi:hypothetical protein D3C73_914790 [compost metagenome]
MGVRRPGPEWIELGSYAVVPLAFTQFFLGQMHGQHGFEALQHCPKQVAVAPKKIDITFGELAGNPTIDFKDAERALSIGTLDKHVDEGFYPVG